MGRLSGAGKALVAALVAYVVADFFLTPLGGLETRPVSGVTPLGIMTLALLFAGLALAIVSVVLLFRGSGRAGVTSIIAAALYFPAPLVEATGHFSKFHAPAAIATLEWIQTLIAVVTIVLALLVLRSRTGNRPAA
jgi:hypothetical protein